MSDSVNWTYLHLQSPEQVEPQHSSLPSLKFSLVLVFFMLISSATCHHIMRSKMLKEKQRNEIEKETFLPQQLLSCSLWIKLIDIRLFGIYIVITNINKIIGLATKWEHNFSKTWIVALHNDYLLMITFLKIIPIPLDSSKATGANLIHPSCHMLKCFRKSWTPLGCQKLHSRPKNESSNPGNIAKKAEQGRLDLE